MIKYCQGCGAPLQEEDPNKRGFIPKIDPAADKLYCKRCFRLNNYNELPKILATNKEYEAVVDDLLTKNGLIVLIVDLFDFTGTFIPKILDKLRNKNVILVANKLDLLPKSVKIEHIVDWLSYMVNRMFFRADAIHVVSSKKGYYLDDLMNTIDYLRKGRDVYFMGCANVGKSSLINALLKRFTKSEKDLISTSPVPGTTLNSIKIPFFIDNKAFIDTPGLINENNILSKILPASYDKIMPNTEIKPQTFQIKPGNTIFFGALAQITLLEGEGVSFTCYFSSNVAIHRRKAEGSLEFLNKHGGEILTPPTRDEFLSLEYEEKTFEASTNKKEDIVISGLGFVAINKKAKVLVKIIKKTDAEPTNDGYSFGGWYTDVNCTTAYDFNLPVNTDITLYARWLAKYTVSFDTDGGSTVESQTVVTGNKATKPAVNPTKKGYNFVGWYTDNTYTTEFDFENTIITDNTSIIRLNGYTFNKISTLEGLTTGYYVIGGYISNSNEYKYMISDMNTTKSFKSSDNPTEFYEIKLKGNSVTIKNSKNMYIISNTEKSVSLSEKEKTIFTPVVNADGFKLKVTGSLNFQFNPSAKIFTSYTSKQQDLTLFKAQNVKPFYVTFKGPNNEELNKEEMLPHQKAPEFEAPNKPGHKFMGWYNEATDAKYDFTTELSEETVLVAKYEALTSAELFEQLEIKNQLAYHWQTEDSTTYTIDNVSLRFGVNLTEEMKSLEGVKFGAILAKKVDVANINLSEYARACASAAEVVAGDPNLKYLEFTNIAAEGGMTSLRLDNLDSALAEEFVVVIYMEYNGKLYVTEQKIASVKVIASEYLKSDLEILKNEQIKGSLNQLSK